MRAASFTKAAFAVAGAMLGMALAGTLGATSPGVSADLVAAQAPASPPQSGAFVGDDTCVTCHESQSYKGTVHGRTFDERTPQSSGHGCESCHGPGKAHVDLSGDATKILNPAKVAPARASEMCVTCHDRGKHALWDGSQHDQRQVGLRLVPQRAPAEGRVAAEGQGRDGAVCVVPPSDHAQAVSLQPHAGARRQDDVLVVPQRPRVART